MKTTNKRVTILIHYAGYLTALVTFAVYFFLMWRYTHMDVLKIIVTYGLFLYLPSVYLPFLIVGEGEDEAKDE